MSELDQKQHNKCLNRFIELANEMKSEGIGTNIVSAGMMTASAVYATYAAAGNDGGLKDSGVDKLVAMYRDQVEQVQAAKKAQAESK